MPQPVDQNWMQQARGPARKLLLATGFVVAYALACLYGDRFTGPSNVALYWPASGLAFAVVVVLGLRWAFLVPVAFAMQALWSPNSPQFLALAAASNLLALLAGGWMARRDTALRPGTVGYAVWMMGAGLVTAVVGGGLGGYTLWVHGMAPGGLAGAQVLWALGDFLGIASVAPALMIAAARWQRGALPTPRSELLGERVLWNLALIASFLAMAWGMRASQQFALGLTALPLAMMMWSAMRFTPLRTSVSALLTVAVVAALASRAVSGFPQPDSLLQTTILIGYLCLLAMLPQGLALSIDEHRWLARRLERRATTDALSGLPNRAAFESTAQAVLQDPASQPMALAYLDLDNLKLVNDTAGHRAGDAVIVAVSRALAATISDGDLLAHLGADEFMVLMRNATPPVARERARDLLHAVEAARGDYRGGEYATTASIGLVPVKPGQVELAELLSQADAACFAAKESGGDRVRVASLGGHEPADPASGMRWTVRIRDALQHDRFMLYAQSIVPLTPEALAEDPGARFELLLRMRDVAGGPPHGPDSFIAAAERFRMAVRIDREVVRKTLGHLEAIPGIADRIALCTMNLSAGALLDDGFVDFVAGHVQDSSFPTGKLCFEITETSAMRDPTRAQRAIDDMRALGIRFALDDFGTGFCSFGHLRALDVDFIKIDGSFVQDMCVSAMSFEVVSSINRIAHLLRKRTIAEHAESARVRTALESLGVDYAQGYAIDHPRPLEEYLGALLRKPLAVATS